MDHNDADPDIAAYVVRSSSLATNAAIIADPDLTTSSPQERRIDEVKIETNADEWTRVDLKISGGKLYLDSGQYLSGSRLYDVSERKEFTSLSMFTNSASVVTAQLIQNTGQVAKVTATIPGSSARGRTYTVTYLASVPTVITKSGNHQFGPANPAGSTRTTSRKLLNSRPLVVRVEDGYETNKPVSGLWVQFIVDGAVPGVPDPGEAFLRAPSTANLWDMNGDDLHK